MKPFIYDIKRTLTGKFTIIIIILLIIVTALSAYTAVAVTSSRDPSGTSIVMPSISSKNGNLTITEYAVNGYGNPVSGLTTHAYIYNYTSSPKSINPMEITGKTNANGYFNKTIKNSFDACVVLNLTAYYDHGVAEPGQVYHLTYNSTSNQQYFTGYIPNSPDFALNYFNNKGNFTYLLAIQNKSDISQTGYLVYTPVNYNINVNVYYNITSEPYYSSTLNMKNVTFYKTIAKHMDFINIPVSKTDQDKFVNVYIANSTNNLVFTIPYEYVNIKPGAILNSELSTFFGILFIPILGIFSAYYYYSRDKMSGVMESILVRPVTRGKLFISRFSGNAISFIAGLLIALGVADIILYKYTGSFISSGTFMDLFAGYLVEAVGFAGLMYLVSQFLKTQGQVLGVGIAFLFILGFMWSTLILLIPLILHISAASSFYRDELILGSISPAYYPQLITAFKSGVYDGISAPSLGINIISVMVVGLIWVLIPSALALYFARKHDN
ncbi:ABC transporter permease subunit [Acidiplasma sp.]|uniref:ABC transporter permease subunit n=1 Tax=Acidiplasma sp. TaxID=1872114 RepID=UPI00258864F1|nr:ABC transporter permease subunit [Acidiplasma sp.]